MMLPFMVAVVWFFGFDGPGFSVHLLYVPLFIVEDIIDFLYFLHSSLLHIYVISNHS